MSQTITLHQLQKDIYNIHTCKAPSITQRTEKKLMNQRHLMATFMSAYLLKTYVHVYKPLYV